MINFHLQLCGEIAINFARKFENSRSARGETENKKKAKMRDLSRNRKCRTRNSESCSIYIYIYIGIHTTYPDKNVRMLVMAFAGIHNYTLGQITYIYRLYTGRTRLLTGEAEERYITRLDKPVQRNILEIRSAIIYYRGSFLRGAARRSANVVSYPRFLHVPLAGRRLGAGKKTQLRGQTAEVGVGKTVKNARPDNRGNARVQ